MAQPIITKTIHGDPTVIDSKISSAIEKITEEQAICIYNLVDVKMSTSHIPPIDSPWVVVILIFEKANPYQGKSKYHGTK